MRCSRRASGARLNASVRPRACEFSGVGFGKSSTSRFAWRLRLHREVRVPACA